MVEGEDVAVGFFLLLLLLCLLLLAYELRSVQSRARLLAARLARPVEQQAVEMVCSLDLSVMVCLPTDKMVAGEAALGGAARRADDPSRWTCVCPSASSSSCSCVLFHFFLLAVLLLCTHRGLHTVA